MQRFEMGDITLSDTELFTFIVNNIGALCHDGGVSIFPPKVASILNFVAVQPKTHMAELAFFFNHSLFGGRFAGEFLHAVYTDMREEVIPEFISSINTDWRVRRR